MINYGEFEQIAANTKGLIASISPASQTLFLSAANTYMDRFEWVNDDGSPISDAQWDEIEAFTAKALTEIMTSVLIGTTFPLVTASVPDGALECDGTIYNRVDYQELYSVLDPAFIIDADTFYTPDLRGRVILGSGSGSGLSTYNPGDIGGEEGHTLIVSEISAHSHGVTDPGHIHTEGIAAPNVTTIGPGAPEPTAIPAVGATAAAVTGVSINNTGGDGTHENRQPYIALRWAIWAT